MLGNDQALEPWLDESLAIYSELLFYQAVYPDLVDWWWEFRVARFNPVGWMDGTIYDYDSFRSYVDAVYLRGALFMQELRDLIGDPAFFAFLRDYVSYGTGAQVTAKDFVAVLARHSVADLDALWSAYFTR